MKKIFQYNNEPRFSIMNMLAPILFSVFILLASNSIAAENPNENIERLLENAKSLDAEGRHESANKLRKRAEALKILNESKILDNKSSNTK